MERAMQELEALLAYLVKHNREHAGELADLAARAQALGNAEAQEQIERGVQLLNESNESLSVALRALEAGHVSG